MTRAEIKDELNRRTRAIHKRTVRPIKTVTYGCAEVQLFEGGGVWLYYRADGMAQRVYHNDLTGEKVCLGPDPLNAMKVDLVLADLRKHMVLDDLANV